MKLGILGDTHGNMKWIYYALDKFNRESIDVIVQLGDFGFGMSPNPRFELKTDLLLKNYGQTLIVVPGNHEDYDLVNAAPLREDGFQQFSPNILIAPRGHHWNWDGREFVALGGGPSLDRTWRKEAEAQHGKKIWWEEEAITEADVQKVIDGGIADVMLAHEAPLGIQEIERMVGHNPYGFKSWDLEYGYEQRKLMTKAFEAVAPETFLHGHYHFFVNEKRYAKRGEMFQECTVTGLTCDNMNLSMGSFDTDRMHASIWDITIDFQKYGANL